MVDYQPCPDCGSTDSIRQITEQDEQVLLEEHDGNWEPVLFKAEHLEVKRVYCDNCGYEFPRT